ncbi:MAG: nucleotidyl transferase AbiEii/AbiGii toxin family protein [Candidatus Diapherotrites archaeon]|nr:nucleotidyl transferase AbiEii/AbiGii toxin family protein [Candidatus Diapherotrites archaeon]
MGWNEINIQKYVAEVKSKLGLEASDEIISKDLLLTLLLAEFQKEKGVFNELVFKGGTLLARNYLEYHRFSEDLDFVYKESELLSKLPRKTREKKIKAFIDLFAPNLKKVADVLGLEFSANRSDTKYCSILHGRTVYTFRLYYDNKRYIKIEINFIEKLIYPPKEMRIKNITDYFDSKELLFILGLTPNNFKVLSYPIEEIILEKYRALLTRKTLMERDLFDLYLIPNSLKIDPKKVVEKIKSSSLIKREIDKTIPEKLLLLKEKNFFKSTEKISDLAIKKYDPKDFEKFKTKIEPNLIKICDEFVKL